MPLDKVYEPHQVERRWYDEWLQRDLFRADPAAPGPFLFANPDRLALRARPGWLSRLVC